MKITNEGYAIIETDTHIGKWVEEHKRLDFDQNTLPLIEPFIKENGTVVDCGANIGSYSYSFAKKADSVICIEPNVDAFECLQYNIRALPHVFAINKAVGNINGKVSISRDINAGASHCVLDADGEIDMITIDSLQLRECDFIKIDVEGFEPYVLQGAIKTIQKFKPKMYIEVNEGALERAGFLTSDIFNILKLFNYDYRNIYEGQRMAGLQYDIIAW